MVIIIVVVVIVVVVVVIITVHKGYQCCNVTIINGFYIVSFSLVLGLLIVCRINNCLASLLFLLEVYTECDHSAFLLGVGLGQVVREVR
jgi:hypothetical protein